jgi:ribose transport system permease protein
MPEPADSRFASHVPTGAWQQLRRHVRRPMVGPYIGVSVVLIALIIYFTATEPQFATYGNVISILQTNATLLIIAVGVTFTVLAGGFDLSIGGVLVLTSILLSMLLTAGVPLVLALVILIVGGVAFGTVFNGFITSWLGVNFFVVTLGSSAFTYGLALALSNGNTLPITNNFLLSVGNGNAIGSIPVPVVISIVMLLVAISVTRYSGFGRMVYAVGGNAEAARLAGINVTRVRVATYAISAGFAVVAGIIEAGQLSSASPATDLNIALTAAAAVLIGGTSFLGGVGTMFGTFLGVLFLGVLQDGLLLGSISAYYQGVITGLVLVAAVTFDRLRQRREARQMGTL